VSTADDVQDAELVEAPMLPLLDWIARQSQYKERTVRRYLAEGRIPAARRDHSGRWWLPVDAQVTPGPLRLATPAPAATVPAAPVTELARVQDVTDARPWLRLDELAELVGLSVHNLRRMAADGQLSTTKGPHGATIIWRGELVRLLGSDR
jgi:hypothetical protein